MDNITSNMLNHVNQVTGKRSVCDCKGLAVSKSQMKVICKSLEVIYLINFIYSTNNNNLILL